MRRVAHATRARSDAAHAAHTRTAPRHAHTTLGPVHKTQSTHTHCGLAHPRTRPRATSPRTRTRPHGASLASRVARATHARAVAAHAQPQSPSCNSARLLQCPPSTAPCARARAHNFPPLPKHASMCTPLRSPRTHPVRRHSVHCCLSVVALPRRPSRAPAPATTRDAVALWVPMGDTPCRGDIVTVDST